MYFIHCEKLKITVFVYTLNRSRPLAGLAVSGPHNKQVQGEDDEKRILRMNFGQIMKGVVDRNEEQNPSRHPQQASSQCHQQLFTKSETVSVKR